MATNKSPWARQVWAVARKDFQAEWRTRHAVVTTLAFAVIALSVTSLSVGSLRSEPTLAAGLFWVILFFSSVIALGRTFVKEEDAQTANLLRLTAEPTAVFAGKVLFNFALLVIVAVVTLPLFVTLMGLTVEHIGSLTLVVFFTTVAMAAMGTILGAMLSKAQSRIAILGVAAFPLFSPALAAALQATAFAFGANPSGGREPLQFLFAYGGISVLTGLLLFDEVW